MKDPVVTQDMMFFAQENLYVLFSLLFGMGFAVQLIRAEGKYSRRA
jgi:uncharacterized membrane protein YeiB